jgi:hypothetical protein
MQLPACLSCLAVLYIGGQTNMGLSEMQSTETSPIMTPSTMAQDMELYLLPSDIDRPPRTHPPEHRPTGDSSYSQKTTAWRLSSSESWILNKYYYI